MATAAVLLSTVPATAQETPPPGSCDFSDLPGIVWWGTEPQMPIERFVSYLAPVFWHSPDEPELEGLSGADVPVPEVMPLEAADGPVVYYQLKEIQAPTELRWTALEAADRYRVEIVRVDETSVWRQEVIDASQIMEDLQLPFEKGQRVHPVSEVTVSAGFDDLLQR